jgi:peptide/nickel transport system substrate-binding protein
MPKESDGRFDPNSSAHGAGPYYLDDFLSGAHYKMSRNPNYYDKPMPYFEKMNWFIVPEAAAQLAQFEAKNLDLAAGVTNDNVMDVFKRHPEMVLHTSPITSVAATPRFGFAPGEPYHDVRVRRAISMAYDRGALAEYFTNKGKLEAQGLPATALWASHITAMWEISGDPADEKSFGPNARYFAHNLAESKRMLAAAGQQNLAVEFHSDNSSQNTVRVAELLAGQLRDAGITVNEKVEDYVSWFLPKVYRGRGNWSGMAYGAVGVKFSPESFIYSHFHPGPGTAHYGEGLFPDLVNRIKAMLKEFDDKKRTAMVKDFERAAAAEMPCLPLGSSGPTFTLAWPWVANAGVLVQWPGEQSVARSSVYSRYWFDQKKAAEVGKPS